MIKLKNITAKEFAGREWGPPGKDLGWLKVPAFYKNLPAELDALRFCTAEVERDSVHLLWNEAFLKSVIDEFELSDPVGYIAPPVPTPGVPGNWTPSVIVGVIDDGLPFANVRFRESGGTTTRIEYDWDQDRPTDLSKAAMDGYLTASQHAGLIDEDEVYRRAGYDYTVTGHKSWARRGTHGAHVMDLACGLTLADVAVDSPHLIGVHLPSRVTADPSGGKLEAHAFGAFLYVLVAAKQVATTYNMGSLPCVANLSYGVNHGPHDGSSLFERAIDFLIALWSSIFTPVMMVLPAGNSHLTRCHAHFQLAPGGAETLQWRVLPDDATPSFLELWLPGGGQVQVTVKTPDQTVLGPIHAGDSPFAWGAGPLLRVQYPGTPEFGGRIKIFLALAPTTTLDPTTTPAAPSGTWQITVTNVNASSLWIDSWIWRDDNPFGYSIRGRQSRFEDPSYERFDPKGHPSEVDNAASHVKRDDSINGIATGSQPVVVGACRRSDLASAPYSAGGPTLGARSGPDVTAWAEWSVACHGMLASGTRSGSVVAVNGTSVAAPQVTRWIADRMAHGYTGDRPAVAAEGAVHPTPNIPSKRGGSGYVPGYSCIEVERRAPIS